MSERREGLGRRTEDWLIQSIYDRMEKAEKRFEKDLERLEKNITHLRQEVDKRVMQLDGEFDKRVHQLEDFHLRLEEREKATIVERSGETEKRVRWSMRVGIGAAAVAIVGTIADTMRSVFHW